MKDDKMWRKKQQQQACEAKQGGHPSAPRSKGVLQRMVPLFVVSVQGCRFFQAFGLLLYTVQSTVCFSPYIRNAAVRHLCKKKKLFSNAFRCEVNNSTCVFVQYSTASAHGTLSQNAFCTSVRNAS